MTKDEKIAKLGKEITDRATVLLGKDKITPESPEYLGINSALKYTAYKYDQQMAEKIQSTLANTIPLWKNQMVLSLGLEHSRQAMEAQRAVTNMTNELLRKNADTLKMGSVETAKEAERGIVDIETLKYTNQSLISTLDDVLRIQQEGAQKREAAEQELRQIEGELKQKMLEMRG